MLLNNFSKFMKIHLCFSQTNNDFFSFVFLLSLLLISYRQCFLFCGMYRYFIMNWKQKQTKRLYTEITSDKKYIYSFYSHTILESIICKWYFRAVELCFKDYDVYEWNRGTRRKDRKKSREFRYLFSQKKLPYSTECLLNHSAYRLYYKTSVIICILTHM